VGLADRHGYGPLEARWPTRRERMRNGVRLGKSGRGNDGCTNAWQIGCAWSAEEQLWGSANLIEFSALHPGHPVRNAVRQAGTSARIALSAEYEKSLLQFRSLWATRNKPGDILSLESCRAWGSVSLCSARRKSCVWAVTLGICLMAESRCSRPAPRRNWKV
jgi:hypothetical protein